MRKKQLEEKVALLESEVRFLSNLILSSKQPITKPLWDPAPHLYDPLAWWRNQPTSTNKTNLTGSAT